LIWIILLKAGKNGLIKNLLLVRGRRNEILRNTELIFNYYCYYYFQRRQYFSNPGGSLERDWFLPVESKVGKNELLNIFLFIKCNYIILSGIFY
jgi:hypothetical protein